MSDVYLPPGWPEAVAPPGTPDWTDSAVAWLLDELVPYLRGHAVRRLMETTNYAVLDV
jgi:hypothetical protein